MTRCLQWRSACLNKAHMTHVGQTTDASRLSSIASVFLVFARLGPNRLPLPLPKRCTAVRHYRFENHWLIHKRENWRWEWDARHRFISVSSSRDRSTKNKAPCWSVCILCCAGIFGPLCLSMKLNVVGNLQSVYRVASFRKSVCFSPCLLCLTQCAIIASFILTLRLYLTLQIWRGSGQVSRFIWSEIHDGETRGTANPSRPQGHD